MIFLADEQTNEGVPRGPRGPKNASFTKHEIAHPNWQVVVSAVMEALLTESLGLGKVTRGAGGRGGGCISQVNTTLGIKILSCLFGCWSITIF